MTEPAPPRPVDVVAGIDRIPLDAGALFAVVGVFDGLHLGHRYLLEELVVAARRRGARPTVITFDSHPDEVILGSAPPLLLDPAERVRLLGLAGVEVVIVQHFDAALRRTPYDQFIRRITSRAVLAGLLMTPDTAFGHERRGTPEALAALGARSLSPFEVVVVPPFTIDGRPVSSSEIRRLVAAGELTAAARLLGRPYGVIGEREVEPSGVRFGMPVALPPAGTYPVTISPAERPDGTYPGRATVGAEGSAPPAAIELDAPELPIAGRLRVVFG